MRNSINPTRCAQPGRQRHRQLDVVNHRPGQDLRIAPRRLHLLLLPAFPSSLLARLPQNRRHLAARIRRRHAHVRQPRPHRQRLAEPDRTPTTDRHDGVGARLADNLQRALRDGRRRVHDGFGEDAGRGDVGLLGVGGGGGEEDERLERFRLRELLRGAEQQRRGDAQAGELGGELLQGAGAEDDAGRVGVVLEWLHGGGGGGSRRHDGVFAVAGGEELGSGILRKREREKRRAGSWTGFVDKSDVE